MQNYTLIIFLVLLWVTVFMVGFNAKKIGSIFHYSDNRAYFNGNEAYVKLNKMMEVGDVSLYTFDTYDGGTRISLKAEYNEGDGKAISSFTGEDIEVVINQSYDWAVAKGYIK